MRFLTKLSRLSGLLLLLVIGACEGGGAPQSPTEPDLLLGGLLGGSGGGNLADYTLANDPFLPGLIENPVSATSLIGLSGGSVQLLGQKITVPRGAVSELTLFTLTVLPTGYVEVDLLATKTNLLGTILNVGEKGFKKPVTVTLTYSRSTNVDDPTKAFILREKGADGKPEAMPSRVDLQAKTVSAELDHFSRYFIALP